MDGFARLNADPCWIGWGNSRLSCFREQLDELAEFVNRVGRYPCLYRPDPEEKRLGRLVANRRQEYRNGRLAPERIKACEAVPGWMWGVRGAGVERGIELIRRFAEQRGRLPTRSGGAEGKRLAQQIHELRANYRRGRLTPERIKACEAIPCWFWSVDRKACVERDIRLIAAFAKQHGHLPSYGGSEEEQQLVRHVTALRRKFRQKKLSQEHIDALQSIASWGWGLPQGEQVRHDIQLIAEFAKQHGHLPSAGSVDPEERRLNAQASQFRFRFKKKRLTRDCVQALEAIPGWNWAPGRGRGGGRPPGCKPGRAA